ncbi:hypothetical protein E1B28_012185 [Marasmius oreades]|uniref:Uncharacterized protein n=1 Tax=Marasmius oreades TaxID=181124 RepID=A0A9P7RRP2_9AGAR|nr:uncharacterized protein E1B28_012185 [Marasmius oreades]KAG7088163.1 hypothetical protein E1B28_012185 [Marasmius oreades]
MTIMTRPPETLPTYSVSSPPPSYSCDPAVGEQLIQRTPRALGRPTGTFKKLSGGVKVVLTEQEDDAETPIYSRHYPINGAIALEHRETITEVKAKVVGQMRLLIPGVNSREVTLVEQHQILWSSNSASGSSSMCPGTLPFSLTLPSTFEDKGASYPLPPTFNLSCLGSSGLTAVCKYSLEIKVVKGHSRGIGHWMKTKKISIPLKHLPRSRPPRPISAECDLFSDLKVSPEEWHQTLTTIPSRSPETIPPVNAHVFIPSTKVFAYGETIPFHIQLTGPVCSLRDLSDSSGKVPNLRVNLLRQASLNIDGPKAWRNNVIADSKLWPIPPPVGSITNAACLREDSLDWQGELEIPKTLSAPGFHAGDLHVKDFILLTVIPADRKSKLQYHQSHIAIKIVTDSWREAPDSS